MFGINDDLWASFCFYGALNLAKMIVMSPLTGRKRMSKKIFANQEDAKSFEGKVTLSDPDVERVRRAHLNDIENIVPFLLIAPMYLSTGPLSSIAVNVLRIFTFGRYLHTISYLNEMQPWRAIGFIMGIICNVFMVGSTIVHYSHAF
ncbi:microsomal glutathione S-transferase 1 [Lepeophtheirus salmonis]|uniref:Microsomal glutathione S-transferase 1 n=1 Tax=Lepeophtheirus salmonis TaxID=72036 RepID=C1BSN7_LEPSM|nr:microsomal glutathione S-transferase 1-like [Lepeophtheirus salmonis]ACO12040.1 Microsomal glutathione S-transferase 1 [Lepeophtheirus salmonis]ADD38495.1 Microsomal glutathione S-transferase 1 [Lepeophtheirus salmonis]URD21391.1 microsomal glutathione S-transferase 1 like protein [Lepeophtheirus salmonis salmonis]